MKSMSKKILAVALILVLALSLGIAAYAVDEPVAVTGVTVTESATVTLGTTKTLTATVAPANATNKEVTWTTSNASVATVDSNGKVTAVSVGNATITATTTDGSFTDTCAVTVTNVFAAEFSVILEDYDDYLDLEALVTGYAYDWAETNLGDGVDVDYIGGITGLDYGEVYDGEYWLEDSDDYYKLPVTDNFSCKVELDNVELGNVESDNVEYKVNVALTLYTTELSADFGISGGNLSAIANNINTLMNIEHGKSLHHIYFDGAELDGGTLYTSSAMTAEAWDDVYTKSAMSALFYLPNGSGETSYLEYVAYGDDDEEYELSGTIVLNADPFMLLDYTISNQDTLTLSAEDFEEAYLELDDDYAYLDRIRFTAGISNGSSKGYLYIDYESDGDDATKVSNSSSKYYHVDPEDSEVGIDTITYVPGSSTKSQVYTITFKAHGFDEDGKEVSKTSGKTGYLRINVVEAADLEITSGPSELTAIDAEWFQDFVAENATTTQKKSYVVTRVVFSGAPASAKEGYLYTDGSQLTGSGSKTFYMDPKDNQNDLNDLYFKGGNTVGTKRVNFTIYGKKATSTSSSDTSVATGTIDFIVGPSRKLQYGVSASQSLSFLGSLPNIQALGNNNNAYIVFSNLPNVGGKLVYTEQGAETPVTVGTRYYLTYTAGQKYLGNVSFAPSYSSSKTARTVTLNVKAGNAAGKEVDGSFDIIVTYAASSMYFSDVQIYNNVQAQKFADSVDYLRNKGITRGNNAAGTTFGINTNVTRAEFVTFLYRAAGQPSVAGLTNTFTDVNATTHKDFYNAILWAVQNGITNGKGNNKFDPDANVTHEELLTFLYRYDVTYKKNPGTLGSLYGFIDGNQVASWAQNAAKWAANKGVINYYTDGYSLMPATAGTRGTVALWLHRMLTL